MQQNLSRPALPLSLKKKRTQRIILRSIACALLLTIFIFVIVMWGNRIFPATQKHHLGYTGLKIMFYIIFLLIPFIITGIPLKLIDKSWSGTVTDIKIVEKLATTSNPRYIITFPKQDLILSIKTDAGREITQTILSLASNDRISGYEGYNISKKGNIYYHEHEISVGDRVHKYYGYKHLFVSYKKPHQTKFCINCGVKNTLGKQTCWHCDAEILVDPSEEQDT